MKEKMDHLVTYSQSHGARNDRSGRKPCQSRPAKKEQSKLGELQLYLSGWETGTYRPEIQKAHGHNRVQRAAKKLKAKMTYHHPMGKVR